MQIKKLITGMQIKAARSTLSLSVRELSEFTDISSSSIKRYESALGIPVATKGHLATLRAFFEARGIEFVGAPGEGPGIRLWERNEDAET